MNKLSAIRQKLIARRVFVRYLLNRELDELETLRKEKKIRSMIKELLGKETLLDRLLQ